MKFGTTTEVREIMKNAINKYKHKFGTANSNSTLNVEVLRIDGNWTDKTGKNCGSKRAVTLRVVCDNTLANNILITKIINDMNAEVVKRNFSENVRVTKETVMQSVMFRFRTHAVIV